jgi:hypothetical protein
MQTWFGQEIVFSYWSISQAMGNDYKNWATHIVYYEDDVHLVSWCKYLDEEQPEKESVTSNRSWILLLCANISTPQELFRGCIWLDMLPFFSVVVP